MHTWKPPWFLLLTALMICGCAGAGVVEKSPPRRSQGLLCRGQRGQLPGVGMLAVPDRRSCHVYLLHGGQLPAHRLRGRPLRAALPALRQAFAVLQCAAATSPTPTVLAQFTAKAKAIGANAIILSPAGDGSGQQDERPGPPRRKPWPSSTAWKNPGKNRAALHFAIERIIFP